jgi:hypothetical protein
MVTFWVTMYEAHIFLIKYLWLTSVDY